MSRSPSLFLSNEHVCPKIDFWRRQYCFLLSRGYELPVSLAPAAGEEPESTTELDLVDATRIADGRPVCIRRTTSRAAATHAHATTRARPAWDHMYNHIAPVWDVFGSEGSNSETHVYVVMPRLAASMAYIKTVADVAEFTQQALAALATLHEDPVNLALGGCTLADFAVSCEPNLDGEVKIRYCITNFARAMRVGEELGSSPIADRRAAFTADLAALGSMLKAEFTERYSNLSCLEPLIVATDPKLDNPVWRLCSFWKQKRREGMLCTLLPQIRLHRLRGRDETPGLRYLRDVHCVIPLLWRDSRTTFMAICGYYAWRAMGLDVEPSIRFFTDILPVIWGLVSLGALWWASER